MTKFTFLEELRQRLAVLSEEERADALQFYTEYFEDAGPENEQAVLRELGSPEEVAARILSGAGKIARRTVPTEQSGARSDSGSYRDYRPERRDSGWKIATIILLLILTSPVWLSLLVAVAATVLGLALAAFCILLALLLVILMLVVLCGACFGVGIWLMPRDLLNGLFVLSIGMMGIGGALILFPLGGLAIRKGFPALGHGIAACWRGFAGWCGRVWRHMRGGAQQ